MELLEKLERKYLLTDIILQELKFEKVISVFDYPMEYQNINKTRSFDKYLEINC